MRAVILLGLLALLPAAVGAAPAQRSMVVPICGGVLRVLPLGHQDVPGAELPGCCAKGCHTGGRKKGKRARFDPAQ
jgi:hypothetical protein